MEALHFGSDSEFVRLEFLLSDVHGEWIEATVEISVHCFRGSIKASFEVFDFKQLLVQLRTLYETLTGRAELCPREEQLALSFVGTGSGHILLAGTAWSQARYGNKLEFELKLDQTYLVGPIAQLETFLEKDVANDV